MPLRFSFPDDEYRKAQARIFESKAQQIIDRSTAEDVTPERQPAFPVRSPADVLSGLDTGAASGLESFGQGVGNVVGGAVRNLPLPAQNVLGAAFDLLGRPQRAVYGAAMEGLRQRDAGEDLFTLESLRKQGEAGLRGFRGEWPQYSGSDIIRGYGGTGSRTADILGGFGLDVVADPLNVIPVGRAGSLVGQGLKTTGKAVGRTVPALGEAGEALADAFVPRARTARHSPQAAEELTNLFALSRTKYEVAGQIIKREFSGLPREVQDNLVHIAEWANPTVSDPVLAGVLQQFNIGLSIPEARALERQVRGRIEQWIEVREQAVGLQHNLLPFYFPHVAIKDQPALGVHARKLPNVSLGGAEERRKYATQLQGIQAGEQYAPSLTALDFRLGNSIFAVDSKHFINRLMNGNIIDVDGNPLVTRAGQNQPLQPGNREFRVKELKGYQAPTPVVKEIEDYFTIFTGDEATNKLLQWLDTATRWQKAAVTVLFPAYHSGNMLGDLWNMTLGGFGKSRYEQALPDPAGMKQAFGAMRHAARIADGHGGQIQVPGRAMSYDEVRDQALRAALIGTGFYGDDATKTIARIMGPDVNESLDLLRRGQIPKGMQGLGFPNLFEMGRRVGQQFEDHRRLSFFIDQLQKGSSIPEAAAQTRKYLFDYGDLAPFERNLMRRVVMFYGWNRKNTPLQIQALLNNPQQVAMIPKAGHTLTELSEALSGDDPITQAEVALWEDWAKEQLQIELGRDEQGKPKVVSSLRLPVEDLNKFYKRTPQNTLLKLAGDLAPVPKMMLEYVTSMSTFTGRHIEDPSYQNYYRRAYPLFGEVPGLREWIEFKEREREVQDPATGQLVKQTFYSANPQRMWLVLSMGAGRFLTTAGKSSDIRKTGPEIAANLLLGPRISTVDVTRSQAEFGTDTEEVQKETAAQLEKYAQEFERSGKGRDYREARKTIRAEERGALNKLLESRAKLEAPRDEQQQEALRRQLLSGPGRVLADYRAITPESVGGSLQDFFQERERFLGRQSPEMQRLIRQRGQDYIKRLGETAPTAARVEREYQQALDEYQEYRAIFEQFGLDTETVEQATEFERQYRDTSGQLGGSPERALRLARDANPEGYAAYRSYLRVRSGPRGERLKRARQRFRAEHPTFMRFFSESVIEQ